MSGRIDADDVKAALTNPWDLCQKLDLLCGARHQASAGALVRCLNHDDSTPSCSVTRGPDGTVRVVCFGCGWRTDALGLIAAAHQLDVDRDFLKVLTIAAEIAGIDPRQPRAPRPPVKREPTRDYLPVGDVAEFWNNLCPPWGVAQAYLEARKIDPGLAYDFDLVRVLEADGHLPPWAAYDRMTWRQSGHLLIIPTYDTDGVMRSVRAARVMDSPRPKRLTPAGFKASGLVMADSAARLMLHAMYKTDPIKLVVVEGEPDFLTWATRQTDAAEDAYAVIGVTSGAWNYDLAQSVPDGSTVIVRTHTDVAGEKYATDVIMSLIDRCTVRRAS